MMISDVLYVLPTGLMWGLTFVGPLLMSEYSAMLQLMGRHLALGLIALSLVWLGCVRLRQLSRNDWWTALGLMMTGNLIYYVHLANAIQRTGAPAFAMIIGTPPVALPVFASLLYSWRDGELSRRRLFPALVCIAVGLICVNVAELCQELPDFSPWRYGSGIALALEPAACWAWYALRNVRWLRENPHQPPMMWATAQVLITLPVSLAGYFTACVRLHGQQAGFPLPFGPCPAMPITLMLAIAVFCSWVGALCWNIASQWLPTVILGLLIVFETLAGLLYTFLLRQSLPPLLTLSGILLLVPGVVSVVRARPEKPMLQSPTDEKKQPGLLEGYSLVKKMHLKYALYF